jgi:DNA-binding NarL/FixJ family response regulator
VADPSWEQLTKREREVIKLVAEGYTSPKIADFLCISQKTVDKHLSNIMGKLDLHSATALTAYVVERGIAGD